MPNPIDFNLYLITDRHQVAPGHTLLSAVDAALQGGVKAVQLREKDLSETELLPFARALRELTRRYDAHLLINNHIELALAIHADGVHLGGHSLPTDVVRQKVGPNLLIGVSTHSNTDIIIAAGQGADFVTFGPVYATPSKTAFGPPQGLPALSEACRVCSLPVFALGGITPPKAAEIRQAGAAGIALISAILASPDPRTAAEAFTACE
ncbi:MAG: thiamine phosphate synthase [Desulfuromonadales bacterium]